MTDPDLQAAHEEAMRQIWAKCEGESRRIFQQAMDDYGRTMRRGMALYAAVILALLIAIAIHISQMPPSAALPT